jgi:hypothetical protein
VNRRGITIVEVLALIACVVVLVAMGLPAFQRVGCSAARDISRANLATLSQAHVLYSTDWEGRQYTLVPDSLGVSGGSFDAWQAANGCVPQQLLGKDSQGVSHFIGTACAQPQVRMTEEWLKPLDFAQPSTAGSYRLSNLHLMNVYVNGRFYDPKFYAPDDPMLRKDVRDVLQSGGDFEDLPDGIVLSTYTYSPAAMFDPRVFGMRSSSVNPTFRNPDTNAQLEGVGYRSPSVAQCVHPSLKTRMMEMWAIENPPAPCNPNVPGCVPYQWNQSFRSRPLTMFFDGSVRIMTPREPMFAEDRANAVLWMQNTSFGAYGVNGMQSGDFLVKTSAHFLTTFGIAGRDTIAY